ncbi:hypothetical protein GCM10010872_10810 [Dyella flava]|nr:hypothetical protein GCM10010872_10810 [Dyella flava]
MEMTSVIRGSGSPCPRVILMGIRRWFPTLGGCERAHGPRAFGAFTHAIYLSACFALGARR